MKNVHKVIIPVFVMASVVAFSGRAAYSKIVTNVPPDISADDVKAVVVEDFENDLSGWKVESTPKKYNTSDENKKKKDPVLSLDLKQIQGAPADLIPERWSSDGKGTKKDKCLGVHFQFRYPGYNTVYVIPKDSIRFPGRVKGLSVWVQGRGKNYELDAWIKDYQGNVHIIKFGSLNYVGWKPLKAKIPEFIPQSIESYPQTKTLVLERFVLRADPRENAEEVFFFFDQLKVLTESFEVNFDGQDLDKSFKGESNQNQNTTQSAGQK